MHLTFDRVGQLKQSVLELLPTDLLMGVSSSSGMRWGSPSNDRGVQKKWA